MHERRRKLGVGALLLLGGLGLLLGLRSSSSAELARRFGVAELRVRRSAAGHLLDLRYRVLDPAKAAPLHARAQKPILVDERSGRKLVVPTTPKAGALRSTAPPKAGRIYFALFANPGGAVRRGDQVSVVMGELRASLVVE